jgi:ankyrin repeat protein
MHLQAFSNAYKHLTRLLSWMLGTIPANFEELESKERRIFENIGLLTSSADFIKACKSGHMEGIRRILAINVSVPDFSEI